MTVLVTGGAGFIGSHVAEALVARGDDGRGPRRLLVRQAREPAGRGRARRGDIREPQLELFEGIKPTVCFHLAAQADVRVSVSRPDHDARINVIGTINLLEAAREQGTQIVFSSTGGAIYGECEEPATEDSPRQPLAPTGRRSSRARSIWRRTTASTRRAT